MSDRDEVAEVLARAIGEAEVNSWHLADMLEPVFVRREAEAYERGHIEGYEKGLLDPGSAWMNALARREAEARAAGVEDVLRRVEGLADSPDGYLEWHNQGRSGLAPVVSARRLRDLRAALAARSDGA